MDSGQITAVLIVAIVMVASIVRARYGYGRSGRRQRQGGLDPQEHAENLRLRDEVTELKERIKVLERITVEKENSLSREIESLRDR
jgi:cell division protein FtsB